MSIEQIQQTLELLRQEFSCLQRMLKTQPCSYAWLTDLPMTDLENPYPALLKTSEISGKPDELRDTAGVLLSDFLYICSEQDNRNTHRTAGIVVLEADVDRQLQLTYQCYVINRLKRQLRVEVGSVPEDDRKKIRIDNNRRINLVQAYRRIPVFARPIDRFSFGWSKNSSTVYRTTVAKFKKHLTMTAASKKSTDAERASALDDVQILDRYPDGPLVRRRRTPPTPIVTVTMDVNGRPRYYKRTASSPLLAFVEPGHSLPRVTQLKHCKPQRTGDKRPDYRYVPVLPHRDLYQVIHTEDLFVKNIGKKQREDWLNRV